MQIIVKILLNKLIRNNNFLNMKNEEILKENNCKRFSVILMNPPYLGANRNDYNK